MTFTEAFEEAKACLSTADAGSIKGHLAVQVELTDEDSSGIFYIEVRDGVLSVEPYDYVDRDAFLRVGIGDFKKIFSGRLGYDKAVADGRMTVSGDAQRAAELKTLIPKPRRKKTATPADTESAAEAVPTKKRRGRPAKTEGKTKKK